MKKQLILFVTTLVLLLSSCSVSIDFDETQGYISVTARGNNANGSVSQNGYLDLDIIGEDDNGITHITIEIPVLNVDVIIDNNSSNNRWEISQTFNVNESINEGGYNIYVALKDDNGNEYTKTVTFTVD